MSKELSPAERALEAIEHTMLGTWETTILPPLHTYVLCFYPGLIEIDAVDFILPVESREDLNPADDAEMAAVYSELFAASIRPGMLVVRNDETVWDIDGYNIKTADVPAWMSPVPLLPGCLDALRTVVDKELLEDGQQPFFTDGDTVPDDLPALRNADAETPLNTLSDAHSDILEEDTLHSAVVTARCAGGVSVHRTQVNADEYEKLRDASEEELSNPEFLASCGALTYTVLPTVLAIQGVRVQEVEKGTGERSRVLYEERLEHVAVH